MLWVQQEVARLEVAAVRVLSITPAHLGGLEAQLTRRRLLDALVGARRTRGDALEVEVVEHPAGGRLFCSRWEGAHRDEAGRATPRVCFGSIEARLVEGASSARAGCGGTGLVRTSSALPCAC